MPRLAAVGAAAVAAAVMAFATAAGATTITSPVQVNNAVSPFAVGCAGPGHDTTGTLAENGEVEPWVSVDQSNTQNVAGAWQQDRWSDGGSHGLVSSVSTNGGTTFGGDEFPDFSRCPLFAHYGNPDAQDPGKEFDRGSDPWVSWGDQNRLYQIGLTVSEPEFGLGLNSGILVSYSDDFGATWTHPTVLKSDTSRGGSVLNDKESITADPDGQHVYAIWDRLQVGGSTNVPLQTTENAIGYRGQTWFSESSDRGQTWSPARIIYDPGEVNQTIANQIAVTGQGTLVDTFVLIRNFSNAHKNRGLSVATMRSTDNGATWSKPTIVSNLVDRTVTTPGDGMPLRTGDTIPDIAVDPTSDNVYLSWQDARSGTPAIYTSTSTDDGKTWGPPVQASDSPAGVSAFTGSVDVNNDGTVAVTYYDFRNDTSDTSTALTDYWITFSTDGGQTWSPSQRVTNPSFNMKDAPIARGFFVGDYEGLDHAGSDFKLFFVQAHPPASDPTDVYTSTVTP
jgi:hypothetical protein